MNYSHEINPILGVKEDPKSNKIYGDAIKFTQNITEIFDFALRKATLPGIMLPNLIESLLDYYTTDLGGKAFILPFPMW